MAAKQLMLPANRAFSSDGLPEAGALVKLYESGTTTPANFYADAGLTISLGSTLVANAAGRLAQIAYQDENTAFRLKVFDADGDELDDLDPYYFGTIYGATILGSGLTIANTRADLDDVATNLGTVYLMEAGREGQFVFDSSDLSAMVALDSQQGIYVPPATAPTGVSGAWVRQYNGPANVSWFGAALDNSTNDRAALQVALKVAGDVEVPEGKTMVLSTGDIQLTSNNILRIHGAIRYTGTSQYPFRVLGSQSNITVTGPGTISSAQDVEFLHFFRLEQAAGTTLDGFRVTGGLNISYTDTVHTGGDRWAIAGNGAGTRKNIIVEDVTLTGRMQLVASMASNGTFQDSEIRNNRIHNAGANPISISCTGGVSATNPGRADNIKITGNTITADGSGHSSVGIFIGIDGSSTDQQGFLQDILIEGNYIDISASPDLTTDILVRIGNDCSNISGQLSTADKIVINNNRIYSGVLIDQPSIATALALTKATLFQFTNNKIYGGDIKLGHLADGAIVSGNVVSSAAAGSLRLGINNGVITSSHNTWTRFTPDTSSSEFTFNSKHDDYLGSTLATDRVFQLNATTAKVQTANLSQCTINSVSASPFSGVRTNGLGTNTVNMRHCSTSTSWSSALTEQTTGTITQYNNSPVTYTPTFANQVNCTSVTNARSVYERNDNYVRVTSAITGSATAGATSTRFTMTLPVASGFTAGTDCMGFVVSTTNANDNGGYVQADATNDVAQIGFIPTSSGAFTINVTFYYIIK